MNNSLPADDPFPEGSVDDFVEELMEENARLRDYLDRVVSMLGGSAEPQQATSPTAPASTPPDSPTQPSVEKARSSKNKPEPSARSVAPERSGAARPGTPRRPVETPKASSGPSRRPVSASDTQTPQRTRKPPTAPLPGFDGVDDVDDDFELEASDELVYDSYSSAEAVADSPLFDDSDESTEVELAHLSNFEPSVASRDYLGPERRDHETRPFANDRRRPVGPTPRRPSSVAPVASADEELARLKNHIDDVVSEVRAQRVSTHAAHQREVDARSELTWLKSNIADVVAEVRAQRTTNQVAAQRDETLRDALGSLREETESKIAALTKLVMDSTASAHAAQQSLRTVQQILSEIGQFVTDQQLLIRRQHAAIRRANQRLQQATQRTLDERHNTSAPGTAGAVVSMPGSSRERPRRGAAG